MKGFTFNKAGLNFSRKFTFKNCGGGGGEKQKRVKASNSKASKSIKTLINLSETCCPLHVQATKESQLH